MEDYNSGDGEGDGEGYGNGSGIGFGTGCGAGFSDGTGNGSGYPDGTGTGDDDGTVNGMRCVLVRTYSAGVHVGYEKKKQGKFITLVNARRLWRWSGAASLSQLAMEGVKNPEKCKFPCTVTQIELKWIEIIPITEAARESIDAVPVWECE